MTMVRPAWRSHSVNVEQMRLDLSPVRQSGFLWPLVIFDTIGKHTPTAPELGAQSVIAGMHFCIRADLGVECAVSCKI